MESSNSNIKNFVANIANQDYKDANAFLQKMVEDKIKNRIKDVSFTKKQEELDK